MYADLSFVMATMGRVQPVHLLSDPLCRSAGVLIACGSRGALCIGCLINILSLSRNDKQPNIFSNFYQYPRPRPLGLLRTFVLDAPVRSKQGFVFHAVICVPP